MAKKKRRRAEDTPEPLVKGWHVLADAGWERIDFDVPLQPGRPVRRTFGRWDYEYLVTSATGGTQRNMSTGTSRILQWFPGPQQDGLHACADASTHAGAHASIHASTHAGSSAGSHARAPASTPAGTYAAGGPDAGTHAGAYDDSADSHACTRDDTYAGIHASTHVHNAKKRLIATPKWAARPSHGEAAEDMRPNFEALVEKVDRLCRIVRGPRPPDTPPPSYLCDAIDPMQDVQEASEDDDAASASGVSQGMRQNLVRRMMKGVYDYDPAQNPRALDDWRHLLQPVAVDSLKQTHDTVRKTFQHGPHKGENVMELCGKLLSGTVHVTDITPLVAMKYQGELYVVFGNRRLRALKNFQKVCSEVIHMECIVHDMDGEAPVPLVVKFLHAATSTNGGIHASFR